MSAVHFGVTLPQIERTWAETRAAALEQVGFQSLWLNDHLYGVPAPHVPIMEAWTTLSAVGAVTTRAQLGTLVSPIGFRNPALLAKMAATTHRDQAFSRNPQPLNPYPSTASFAASPGSSMGRKCVCSGTYRSRPHSKCVASSGHVGE